MKYVLFYCAIITSCLASCSQMSSSVDDRSKSAKEILGHPRYQAFSFGAYQYATRDSVPSVADIKDNLRITEALGVRLLRTYNTQHYAQARNLLQAIKELKQEDADFEMYVMLGTWIQCKGAWSGDRHHNEDDYDQSKAEIDAAVSLTIAYPDIVKIIAVGNEAMITWADGYFVEPKIILNWVNYLQDLKISNELPADLWITSSDNFEAWGGGSSSYHTKDLEDLIIAVDFVSLHTYPYHASNYQPMFWGTPNEEMDLSDIKIIDRAMLRATDFAIEQYTSTAKYISDLGIEKPIHIGETGWATTASRTYGDTGSHAADEYKEQLFYKHIRNWTNKENIGCFYFKLLDEIWKNPNDPNGSENHFGLINAQGEAKYALWDDVDNGLFDGMELFGKPIVKTFGGDKSLLMKGVLLPPTQKDIGIIELNTINTTRTLGEEVNEDLYIVTHNTLTPNDKITHPSQKLTFTPIDGTCNFKMLEDGTIDLTTGNGAWWACALKIDNGAKGENLGQFKDGAFRFEIKGNTTSSFEIGFQTGNYTYRTLVMNSVSFNTAEGNRLTNDWVEYTIPIRSMGDDIKLDNITSLLSLKGIDDFDKKNIYIRNVYYSQTRE